MFEKVKEPPKKLWTDEDRRRYHKELQEQRELREKYRKRLFDRKPQGGR